MVLGGVNHDRTTRILREFTDNVEFADPLLRLGVPALLDQNPVLGLAADVGLWPVRRLPGPVKARSTPPVTASATPSPARRRATATWSSRRTTS